VPISAAFYQGPHIKVAAVAGCWQRVGDLIGSGFDLNPIHPEPEADVLPLAP